MEALLILAVICGVICLRVQFDRQVREWIDAGLITRKPRAFLFSRRYK